MNYENNLSAILIYLPDSCCLSGPYTQLSTTYYVHHYFTVSQRKNLNCASFCTCM